jgi:hypothetical protein
VKKRFFLLPILLLILTSAVWAEKNYSSDKIIFLPQDFYVGDLVEMRVVIRPDAGVSVAKPEKFPDSYWVEVENADLLPLEENEYELRVFLRPYAPGIRSLPALQFGDIILKDIRIQTKSVLDDENAAFAPPADQVLLPGTNYYIALIVGLVFFLPLFFIFFWKKLKQSVLNFIYEKHRKRPYKRIIRVFNELDNSIEDLKGREFYTILVDELRAYLTSRGNDDYSSSTVREAAKNIMKDFSRVSGYYNLITIFELADQVKFGNRRVMIKTRKEDLDRAWNCVDSIEELSSGGDKHVDL